MDGVSEVALPWVKRAEQLAGLGTWTLELPTGRVTSNVAVRKLLGLAPDQPAPTLADYFRAVHPDDQAELAEHWRQLLHSGREYVVEHRLLLPSGRLRYMRAVACVGRDEADRIVVAHGITQDVTDRRVAALEVERQRDLSRTILASLHEGFMITRGSVVVEVNPALCDMTGFSEEELLGSGPAFPFWPREELDVLQRLRMTARSDGCVREDAVLGRKDGTRFPAHLISRPLPAEDDGLWLTTIRDVTAEKEHERVLLRRAETDPLTGVLNSRAFRDALVDNLARVDGALSLALIDIDNYKQVNDDYGHAVGDAVLCEVVTRLKAATGEAGILGRVGGDEFALLLPGTAAADARVRVSHALQELRGSAFRHGGTVTASAGVAEWEAGHDEGSLYRQADVQLYLAKAQGRDQVQ